MFKAANASLLGRHQSLQPYIAPLIAISLITVFGIIGMSVWTQRNNIYNHEKSVLIENSLQALHLIGNTTQSKLHKVEQTTRMLADNHDVIRFGLSGQQSVKHIIENQWMLIANDSHIYEKIRFIDTNGYERINVEYQQETETSYVNNDHQYRGNSEFMRHISHLHNSDNMSFFCFKEGGEVSDDIHSLAGRVTTPVLDASNVIGYIVVNFKMSSLVQMMKEQERISGFSIDFLTQKGGTLSEFSPPSPIEHHLPISNLLLSNFDYRNVFNTLLSTQYSREIQGNIDNFRGGVLTYRWLDIEPQKAFKLAHQPHTLLVSHIPKEVIDLHARSAFISNLKTIVIRAMIGIVLAMIITYLLKRVIARENALRLMFKAVEGMSAVLVTDSSGEIIRVNKAFTEVMGYEANDVIGKNPKMFSSGTQNKDFYRHMWKSLNRQQRWTGEIVNRKKNGEHVHIIQNITVLEGIRENGDKFFISNFVDVTQQKKLQEKLVEQSQTDALTGAYNRRHFDYELKRLQQIAQRYLEQSFCLAIIDLDHFKSINDILGHSAGDEVLKKFVACAHEQTRDTDQVFRIGGEEFALLMPLTCQLQAVRVVERIRQSMKLDNITFSAGIAEYSKETFEHDLLNSADQAMYTAKNNGRDRICIAPSEPIFT
ncbi:sensor domain-containing diguanylate cyclase [Echinimonas agarilytica]|uniref:diguanylate cyclase n=1 Tax=Echinimonas agarilytica TaxID=1215918 RepID=A0AA41W7M1_9GAMM|nr:diguanylate cyclase [Echinimonas agarilytica]MCM2680038.1 diguanylate cyclase [Echinimonas agarilytica]